MDTRTDTEPASRRTAPEPRIRTCRAAIAETGREAKETQESNPEWNIVRGED
ncbi:hypothetical protein NLX86_18375 [Streptomyces sp. A3M-1-3]|uniref:hypothetical protein n=1 Tax=Streptomyces sp. A3M-1-3 TaxID=2962044 RepID=UPI0020B6E560|nr:hypothetical protein [Streptomyces sp. A3M-1-3]MCP3819988.1 hypothetical protein [Streptomyces sp. A3M-1-3]